MKYDRIHIQACINSYGGEYGPVVEVFEKSKNFAKENVEGILGIKNGIGYIVFRGSDGYVDWRDNFKFWRTEIPYDGVNPKIRVHSGFLGQYKKVRRDLLVWAQRAGVAKVIVTGHSLGGALAVLCAVDLNYNLPNLAVKCVTFGAPRVGNAEFVRSFNGRIPDARRYKYRNDTVTMVPPALMGARHAGKLVWIKEPALWKKILMYPITVMGWPWDHYPQRYLEAV